MLFRSVFYPLDGKYEAAEKENKQPSGILRTVALTVGPYTKSAGAYEFFGNNTSYIEFPTNGSQVPQIHSITLMCWVEPGGQDGPLFSYGQTGHGVGIWINLNGTFFHKFHNKEVNTDVSLAVEDWVHVAATYNHTTEEDSLYINGVFNKSQIKIDAGPLSSNGSSTNDPKALMGVAGDRHFKGKIAQMKIYYAALDEAQIKAAINQGIKLAYVCIKVGCVVLFLLSGNNNSPYYTSIFSPATA